MVEVSEGEIQMTVMDHHGLVAAICQDLKIAERIDNRLPSGACLEKRQFKSMG
ncbi:MAG: DUF4277 domain-containing protein [Candidatus Rhabdochlamydia oedothoracis]|nr:DUF4277 domain-containing protein [Candidatus Rhabdochlamydia oedothoracis]